MDEWKNWKSTSERVAERNGRRTELTPEQKKAISDDVDRFLTDIHKVALSLEKEFQRFERKI